MKNSKNFNEHLFSFISVSKSTIKMLLLVVAITFSTVLSASTIEPKDEDPTTLTEKIQNLLKIPNFTADENMEASVTLIFNKNRELVVLAVDSESELVSGYIKSRLNYKKLNIDVDDLNKTFVVPVKIQVEQ